MEIYTPSDLPLFNQDLEGGELPPSVVELREKLAKADAFIFSCCEYNYSISAPLKNAIDWASRSPQPHGFYDKPAAVVSAGGGFGGMKAQMHLHDIFLFLNLHIMNTPQLMCKIFQDPKPFDLATGDLVDEGLQKRAGEVMAALAAWTYRLKP